MGSKHVIVLVLIFCLIDVIRADGEGDGGAFVFPDQFINMLGDGHFRCPECGPRRGFLGYKKAEFALQLNKQWIKHMEKKLNRLGYEIYPAPPIIVNWFDFDKINQRTQGGQVESAMVSAQVQINGHVVENAPPKKMRLYDRPNDKIGHIFGTSMRDSIDKLNDVQKIGGLQGHSPSVLAKYEKIPKITSKEDMIKARKKTEENESDVFFIFFHNEANSENRHIGDYLKLQEEYEQVTDFYRTDTGFALFWSEKLDIYRMFDTIVAVHIQHTYQPRPDNPTIMERATYLPIEYQYYDEFVQLQNGDFQNFVRLHLGKSEEYPARSSDAKQFPHVDVQADDY